MGVSSDEENDGDGLSTPPRTKKPKTTSKRQQKFRNEWRSDTKSFGKDVKAWLDSDPTSKYKARCKWCDATMTANKTTIQAHEASRKHSAEAEKRKSNLTIETFAAVNAEQTNLKHKIAVKRAEIKLAGCFAAHNIPFRFMDHLIPAIKSAIPDSSICKDMDMKRLKCTRVVTNVIGKGQKEDLTEILKTVKFSVLTDESTHFNVKTAAVAVRYRDKKLGRIVTK